MVSSFVTPPLLPSGPLPAVTPSLLLGVALMAMLPLAQSIVEPPIAVAPHPVSVFEREIPTVLTPPPPTAPLPAEDKAVQQLERAEVFPALFPVVPSGDVSVGHYVGTNRDYAAWNERDAIVDWDDLTLIPQAIAQPRPIYPPTLRRSRVEGAVRVQYLISAQGTVSRVRILSSDHPEFSAAAENSLRQWRFQPGERDGQAVAVWVVQSIPFRIQHP